VIVNDLDLMGVALLPSEADAPLVVHAGPVLPGTVAPELLQSLPRRDPEILQRLGGIDGHGLSDYTQPRLSAESQMGQMGHTVRRMAGIRELSAGG
jgi:hypothetical protein